MKGNHERSVYVLASIGIILLVLMVAWLKAGHTPSDAVRVAEEFVHVMEAKQYEQAFELTVKQGYVGRTPTALQTVANHEFCDVNRSTYTFPFQSNGNRLRRRILGREVEMPEVYVEFEGTCLMGVTLHRTRDKTWRVFKFAAHAG